MTKNTVGKAAWVFTKDEHDARATETVQLAVPIPRSEGRWFRHFALDRGLSMAELIRRILRDFMAAHGGPPNGGPIGAVEEPGNDAGDTVTSEEFIQLTSNTACCK